MSQVQDGGGERGQVAAFFDVDHTLIACNSARKWVEHLWRNDQISVAAALRSVWWLVKYRMSILDYEQVTAEVVREYAGRDVLELAAEVERWFHQDIEPEICVEGIAQIAWHRERGHMLAMLTSGTTFSVEPLRKMLAIPHLICTEVEVVDGKLTGRHVEPSCFGPGKLLAAGRFAETHGIDLDRSYFYTDSFSDLPMLERVGEPRVINPDPRLRRWATQHRLPVELWRPQGRPGPMQADTKQTAPPQADAPQASNQTASQSNSAPVEVQP
ncbi:HAD family hydrolase [Pseudenhygromyxa sp. WMMC2535]|uniref:HAD-IB family hydrolase n=1 Tax=Pseudenhygromyxa sp. WMMC2535 TaxID=2712867 RepID=UPI001557E564|nr:HAD family hydrolase [Pseudenhygromyxa sp. WMMC2535]